MRRLLALLITFSPLPASAAAAGTRVNVRVRASSRRMAKGRYSGRREAPTLARAALTPAAQDSGE